MAHRMPVVLGILDASAEIELKLQADQNVAATCHLNQVGGREAAYADFFDRSEDDLRGGDGEIEAFGAELLG